MIISLVLLLVVAWFVVDRIMFLQTAKKAAGSVVSLTSHNDRCGSKRSRHSCTRYHAIVGYAAEETGRRHSLKISAGTSRGHDQPLSNASMQMNDVVPVIYSSGNPDKVYEDTTYGVWGTPIIALVAQLCAFFTSLTEPRRRRIF